MSRGLTLGILTLALVACVVGCGKESVYIRDGAEAINLEREKMLVLPCDAWGFGSEGVSELEIAGALTGGVAAAFGESAIPLQPLKEVFEAAGIGGMSQKLANGTYHLMTVHNQSFDLTSDSCGQGIEKVPSMVAQLVTMAAEKMGFDFKPRYIFAVALNGQGKDMTGTMMKYRVIACIYDNEMKLIHSCTYYEGNAPAGKASLAKIQGIPKEAFNKIMSKLPAPADAGEGDGDTDEEPADGDGEEAPAEEGASE